MFSEQKIFPQIMGVLNVTPDSFSDGIGVLDLNERLLFAEYLIKNGADIIDIGGESTRPNSDGVSANVELDRVLPILKQLKDKYPCFPISIDTRKIEVAAACLQQGADIINDVSGLSYDKELANVVAKHNASLVITHSKGTPKTMQDNPVYEDVVAEVFSYLQDKISFARSEGVEKIIIDVGIGFGKTLEHNLTLLRHIDCFSDLNTPMLLGISRKRFIQAITGIDSPVDRDTATMIYHTILLRHQNISIIRVHNVELAIQMKKIYSSLY